MRTINLSKQDMVPLEEGDAPLIEVEVLTFLEQLNPRWTYVAQANRIAGVFKFKNYAFALHFVNALSEKAEDYNHHPDIRFGWGYAEVEITTHDLAGLHVNDFILAAEADRVYDDLLTPQEKEIAAGVAETLEDEVPVLKNEALDGQ